MVISVVSAARALLGHIVRLPSRRTLATQVLLLQVAVVAATVITGALVSGWLIREQVLGQYQERSLALARAVAATPDIVEAFDHPQPAQTIQPIAEAIRRGSQAAFVVVANIDGIRYSHPNPARIGERVSTDPSTALSGQDFVGVERGTLGSSVRAKVPVLDTRGEVIGMVSLGFLEEQVTAELLRALPLMTANVLLALGLGVVGSLGLARRLRRQTFDLEPKEIGALLEQREAMLHGIREGVLATDGDGRITLINDEARRLLGLDESCHGKSIAAVVPTGRIRDALTGDDVAADQIVLASERVLVTNRTPVLVRGRQVGAIVTLRDRTELEGVLRELDSVRSLAQALRAQTHEFANKLHTVAGLVEIGRHEEAIDFITETTLVHQALVDLLQARIAQPVVVALLLAKAAVAAERGVEFRVGSDTRLLADAADGRDLVTVAGNLLDNAIEAVTSVGGGWVEVSIEAGPEGVDVRVRDSGPGVDPGVIDRIFGEGFTTKTDGGHHGIGLALVHQVAHRRGGWVRVANEDGAVFTVLLPSPATARA